MKKNRECFKRIGNGNGEGLLGERAKPRGFTLIELLVVIAIIAVLAAMIFPITGAVQRAKVRSKSRAEISQVSTWIDAYKEKMGHYPPDNANPLSKMINPLYYELGGATRAGNLYRPLPDPNDSIPDTTIKGVFGIDGIVNSSVGGGGEDRVGARKFIDKLVQGQARRYTNANGLVAMLLTSTIPWPNGDIAPYGYNSSNPVHNPGSYDLWVDVIVGGKTNRISNWSKEPLIVGSPN